MYASAFFLIWKHHQGYFAFPSDENDLAEMGQMEQYAPDVRTQLINLSKMLADAEANISDDDLFGEQYPDMYDERLRALIESA